MSDRPVSRLSEIGRLGLIATSLIGSLAFGSGSIAMAQDATPEATAAGPCVPLSGITAAEATPDVAVEASPVATEAPVGNPADDVTTEAALEVMQNVMNCSSDPDALATLVTPGFTMALGGYASIEEAQADDFFENAPLSDATLGSVTSYSDGTVGVNIQYWQTEYQILSEKWVLADVDGEWKIDGVNPGDPIDIDGDSTVVGVNLLEVGDGTYSIEPNRPNANVTDILILQAINAATNLEGHELAVLKLPEGATADGLFDGSIPDEDIEFIGVGVVPVPGDSIDINLVALPAGVYTFVCFFPGPDGQPHAMNGMTAQFEVIEPTE